MAFILSKLQTSIGSFSLQGHFILWHRYFIATYEKTLREVCGYRGAQPYWNWTIDVASMRDMIEWPVFNNHSGFGGNGPYVDGDNPFDIPERSGGGCVPRGPFKYPNWVVHLGPGLSIDYNPRCLKRDFSRPLMNWATSDLVNWVTNVTNYEDFAFRLENLPVFTSPNLHGAGHFGVGGALDPLFYLHHSTLDKIFWRWQQEDLPNRFFDVGGPVIPFDYGNSVGPNITLDFVIGLGGLAPDIPLRDIMNLQGGTTKDELIPTLRYWFAYQIIYPVVLLFIKLSILSFYRGLSPTKKYRYAVKIVTAFVVLWTTAAIFAHIFECPDPSKAWSLTFPQGCVSLPALYYSSAAVNIASDVAILLLPIPVIHNLRISRRRRASLIAILSVGGIAVASSGARLWAVWKYQNTTDVSYDAILILLFSHIEINLAIMCACAPALKPLFKTVSLSLSSLRRHSKTTATSSRSQSGPSGVTGGHELAAIATASHTNIHGNSFARNRAVFESMPDSRRESPERNSVEITGGTPYHTPPSEFDTPLNSNPDRDPDAVTEGAAKPATAVAGAPSCLRSQSTGSNSGNYQVDGTCSSRRRQSEPASTNEFGMRVIPKVPRVAGGQQPSKMVGEFTAACYPSESPPSSSTPAAPEQESAARSVHRSVILRQPGVSEAASGNLPEHPSADAEHLELEVEHEIKVDFEPMTPEEQEKWEQKRAKEDATDPRW
ncbi:Tyrosinase [Drechslerella dactyloides]|uniref:Tyrosinase n=1 Tax=Drechslerella dactyloides TaxID=74499 RepID=A0AAD6NK04_DREDA|nr:Tyrosinase [Drechslerella dactyloides]